MAAGASSSMCGPVQVDLHSVVSDGDLVDVQADEVGHGDRDAQRTPPSGSRSPERASLQYYVSWSACTEKEPEPRPEYRTQWATRRLRPATSRCSSGQLDRVSSP